MDNAFLDAPKRRRTQYFLGRNLPVSYEVVTTPIREAIKIARPHPSILANLAGRHPVRRAEHQGVGYRQGYPAQDRARPDGFVNTEKNLNSFAAGAGTVLFFEDQDAVKALQEKFALYADNFPVWSEQAGGMAQLSVWSTLANAGIGASLQHYNPLIDEAVAKLCEPARQLETARANALRFQRSSARRQGVR